MPSEKFLKFIEMWEKDFAIARTIDEKVCIDRDGNPIPWYTYPAIEYLSQFDYRDKKIFEFGCGYSSLFWAKQAKQVISIEDNQQWFEKWQQEFSEPNLNIKWRDEGEIYENAIFENDEKYDRRGCREAVKRTEAAVGAIRWECKSDRIRNGIYVSWCALCLWFFLRRKPDSYRVSVLLAEWAGSHDLFQRSWCL